jgi:two-component system OmpR family response regulator
MADVLVVDDDPDIRGLLAFTLEDEGHRVRVAGDGEAALAAIAEQAPDCMVLDLMMPGLDGFAVLRTKRQQGLAPDTRVLILTCKTAERDYVRGWELGADEYVTKPFDPMQVVARVGELLAVAPKVLAERRDAELQKAELLDRLESAFSRPGVIDL